MPMKLHTWNCTDESKFLMQEFADEMKKVSDKYANLLGESESGFCIIDINIDISVDKTTEMPAHLN